MTYQNGNYCAFYVSEPFNESALQAHATPDFVYYNMLRAWKGKDSSFPFNDSHQKTYSVRDGSNWELTLKPRLRERLKLSKNIILFLSRNTTESKALKEEIEYGITSQGLPIIVVYTELESLLVNNEISKEAQKLWERLPALKNNMSSVPTLHIPLKKDLVIRALTNKDFTVQSKCAPGVYRYNET